MRRPITIIALIALSGLLLYGCSGEPAAPAADDHAGLPLPDKSGGFLYDISQALDTTVWDSVSLTYNRLSGADIALLPTNYPANATVRLKIPANSLATTDGFPLSLTGTIYLPAQPAGGGYLQLPKDCVIYRYQNLVTPGGPDAKVSIPIMSWFREGDYLGKLIDAELWEEEDGHLYSANETVVPILFGSPLVPGDVDRVTSTIHAPIAGVVDPADPKGHYMDPKPGEDGGE